MSPNLFKQFSDEYLMLVFTLLSVETNSISSSLLQYSPLIDNENFAYVHHMLVYICAGLNETQVNDSAPCYGGVGERLSECLAGEVIGGWAVGGEVSNILSFCLFS